MLKKAFIIFLLVSVYVIATASYSEYKGTACANFSAVKGDRVLFGNSEDASGNHPLAKDPGKTVIWFIPSSDDNYGMMQLGWYSDNDERSYQGGMNEYGLCYDSTTIPEVALNDHPERSFNPSNSNLWEDIIGKHRSVEEAVGFINDYNLGSMWYNLFLTDASGNSVIISPGPDGELVFDYLDPERGFMVQTNFNRSNPISHFGPYPDPRYSMAFNMLQEAMDSSSPDHSVFLKILDEISYKNHDAYTAYSNILDPIGKKAYIYFAAQFNEQVIFDLDDELSKGEHEFMLRDLVSSKTYENGLEYHKDYLGKKAGFTILAVLGVAAAVAIIGGLSVLRTKRRLKRMTGN